MLALQDLTNEFNKFDYYISNSSGGFVVWECNEFLSKNLIVEGLKKYSQVTFINVLNSGRSSYLNLLNEKNNTLDKKKIFVFNNLSQAYAYDNYFDIHNLLKELNFTRDVWAKYEYIYVFILPTFLVDKIMKGSPSFWSYVSIHFRIPNIINNPLPFAKIKKTHMEQFHDESFFSYCFENNNIINLYKQVNNNHDKEYLLNKMIRLYNSMECVRDDKVLKTIYFNLSRLFSLNNKFEEAFYYAIKSDEIYSSPKTQINVLYCELNMGYKRNRREMIYHNNPRELYFNAVEHFAYGNLEVAYDLVQNHIHSAKRGKYTCLFYELLAVLCFAKKNYRSSLDIFMKILFESDRIKDDNIFFNSYVIENNLEIVSRYLT